jgi:sterol O-acyltransferase
VRWAVIDFWWRRNQNVIEYLEIIWMGFDGISQYILIWIVMCLGVLLVYPGFRLWFWCRKYCNIKSCYCGHLFIIIYSLYQLSLLTGFTYWTIIGQPLGRIFKFYLAISLVISTMKIHSFVRICAAQVVGNSQYTPSFKAYLYFMWVPTFIYCDEYPRNDKIRWKFLLRSALESLIFNTILLMIVISVALDLREFRGKFVISMSDLLSKLFINLLYGIPFITTVYIGTFHSTLNLNAEVFKFADRNFYFDWWNSGSCKEYIRKTNKIVQNFTNYLLYQDFKEFFDRRKAKTLTFFVSGVFHDLIIFITLEFFVWGFTASFTLYGFFTAYVWKGSGNINKYLFWTILSALYSIYGTFLAVEFNARIDGSCESMFELCIFKYYFIF